MLENMHSLFIVMLFAVISFFVYYRKKKRRELLHHLNAHRFSNKIFEPMPGLNLGQMWTEKSTYLSAAGIVLRTYSRDTTMDLKGIILLLSEFGACGETYGHVAELFSKWGYRVVTFDYAGCGQSEGKRGVLLDWRTAVTDVEMYVTSLLTKYGDVPPPVFAIGQSWGGTLALATAIRYPALFDAVSLVSPILKLESFILAANNSCLVTLQQRWWDNWGLPVFSMLEDQCITLRRFPWPMTQQHQSLHIARQLRATCLGDSLPCHTISQLVEMSNAVRKAINAIQCPLQEERGGKDMISSLSIRDILRESRDDETVTCYVRKQGWHNLLLSHNDWESIVTASTGFFNKRVEILSVMQTMEESM